MEENPSFPSILKTVLPRALRYLGHSKSCWDIAMKFSMLSVQKMKQETMERFQNVTVALCGPVVAQRKLKKYVGRKRISEARNPANNRGLIRVEEWDLKLKKLGSIGESGGERAEEMLWR